MWHRFFGPGLVAPLDQMHSENPASHPELLDWLARDVKTHGYDLKRLIARHRDEQDLLAVQQVRRRQAAGRQHCSPWPG